MDLNESYITDNGVVQKKDSLSLTIIILSRIITCALAIFGILALYTAAV